MFFLFSFSLLILPNFSKKENTYLPVLKHTDVVPLLDKKQFIMYIFPVSIGQLKNSEKIIHKMWYKSAYFS